MISDRKLKAQERIVSEYTGKYMDKSKKHWLYETRYLICELKNSEKKY